MKYFLFAVVFKTRRHNSCTNSARKHIIIVRRGENAEFVGSKTKRNVESDGEALRGGDGGKEICIIVYFLLI